MVVILGSVFALLKMTSACGCYFLLDLMHWEGNGYTAIRQSPPLRMVDALVKLEQTTQNTKRSETSPVDPC